MAVTFPKLNPIIFKEDKYSPFEQANSLYYQKWNKEDYIVFQVCYDKIHFTSGEVVAELINDNESGIACQKDVISLPDAFQSVFRVSCDVNEGIYRIKLTTTSGKFIYYSNYFCIGMHPNTMLINYLCKRNKFDCIFNTSEYLYYFFLRVEGDIKTGDISYNADDVFYTSQERKTYLIDSIPYTARKYTFGDSYGLPVWLADRLNRALGCDVVNIDNIVVVKNDGAKLEATSSDAYPYIGLKIELLRMNEGNSEILHNEEAMQSGISVEMIDRDNSFSLMAAKTGRIHIETFNDVFN